MDNIEITTKQKKIYVHLILISVIIFNFFIYKLLNYGISNNVAFILKIILCITGINLFYKTIKPFEKKSIYFSFYFLYLLIILVGMLYPTNVKSKDKGYIFSNKP